MVTSEETAWDSKGEVAVKKKWWRKEGLREERYQGRNKERKGKKEGVAHETL